MIDDVVQPALPKVLMRDGVWLVPENERPALAPPPEEMHELGVGIGIIERR